jgi:hypothetical protein
MVELTVSEAAARLGVTVQRVRDLLTGGEILGRRLANRMWLVDGRSLSRYEVSARRGRGRQLDAASAWGLLWELSDLSADWLTPSTLARQRRRIRESTAEQIARSVAKRAVSRRFTAANAAVAQAGLIATGRVAGRTLETGLIDDASAVAGYVRGGSMDDYAAAHFMVADPAGHAVLYAYTLPIDYQERVMPAAVVAADLSVSTDTRVRSAGLSALEELRQTWLAAR